jgi:hypothetical protein
MGGQNRGDVMEFEKGYWTYTPPVIGSDGTKKYRLERYHEA